MTLLKCLCVVSAKTVAALIMHKLEPSHTMHEIREQHWLGSVTGCGPVLPLPPLQETKLSGCHWHFYMQHTFQSCWVYVIIYCTLYLDSSPVALCLRKVLFCLVIFLLILRLRRQHDTVHTRHCHIYFNFIFGRRQQQSHVQSKANKINAKFFLSNCVQTSVAKFS